MIQTRKLKKLRERIGEVINCLEEMNDETYSLADDTTAQDRVEDLLQWQMWIAQQAEEQ